MEEASFEMLQIPPKKEKPPGHNAAEAEDTSTAKDTESPTKIDPTEAMETLKEQQPPHPRSDTPRKDRWRYLPPDARCKTVAELRSIVGKDIGGNIDLVRSLWASLRNRSGRDRRGQRNRTHGGKKSRSEYSPSRCRSQDKDEEEKTWTAKCLNHRPRTTNYSRQKKQNATQDQLPAQNIMSQA